MSSFKRTLQQIARYPSAVGGTIVILLVIGIAFYAMITIPYSEAIRLWRGGEEVWGEYPKNAHPTYTDWFTKEKLPRSIVINSVDNPAVVKTAVGDPEVASRQIITYTFDYAYDGFPKEIVIFMTALFPEKRPHASILWITPDGREIRMGDMSVRTSETFRPGQDARLQRRLGGLSAEVGLFAQPDAETPTPLKGTYQMVVDVDLFEPNSNVEAKLVIHGQIHGLAGTDHLRRDLMVALLWGAPVALAFGLLAAMGSTITTMIIAATGVWFGGWVDGAIQRITEVNMILPFLPILIMIGTLYTRSIWVILSIVILLSIFGSAIKTYRAVFLQVKEAPYIEAARAYGASNTRIIFQYMIPRIIPMLIPQLVVSIPTYVFLEASLALLGLGDPVLPTWGKLINEARSNGALFQGYYYWMLEPFVMLMLTGLGFATLGFALDRIFNPRLRGL
jgi:peptide/nickel transport system permease protein